MKDEELLKRQAEPDNLHNKTKQVSNSLDEYIETVQEILDLARTGLVPMAMNMTEHEWARHKLYRIEGKLNKLRNDMEADSGGYT